jgi:threonine aldolase
MIEAIVDAHKNQRFGDDIIGDCEVVLELQEKAASILGKEASLFVTSGTQGNLIALLTQTRRGEEVVVEELSHSYRFESGSMASVGGLYPKPVKGDRGYIHPDTLQAAISPDDQHYPKTSLVVIENTHSYAGGVSIKPDQVKALSSMARDHGLKVHCDGARLFNAAISLDLPANRLVESVDSVQICLSKGLSAPVGSIVAGTEEFIYEAHRIRKRLGGAMRQAGVVAAPAIIALETMVNRLKDDHDNAKLLYNRIVDIPNLVVEEPETNIVFLNLQNLDISQPDLSSELAKEHILVFAGYGDRSRLVLNRMVTSEDVERVAEILRRILTPLDS